MPNIIPDPTHIYRITHYRNLPFILNNGLCCPNHQLQDPRYVNIGHRSLINLRGTTRVPIAPGGVLNDYVPFYFTRRSPMLYVISRNNVPDFTGDQSDIIYLTSSAQAIEQANLPFVFTDRHAKLFYANFYSDLRNLSVLDWGLIESNTWYNTPILYDRKERKQAEFLVYQHVPINLVVGITCYNARILRTIEQILQENASSIPVRAQSTWYY